MRRDGGEKCRTEGTKITARGREYIGREICVWRRAILDPAPPCQGYEQTQRDRLKCVEGTRSRTVYRVIEHKTDHSILNIAEAYMCIHHGFWPS